MNPTDRMARGQAFACLKAGFALIVDAAILPGKAIIRGTRLSVEFVVGLLANGWSEADVLRNYPNLVH